MRRGILALALVALAGLCAQLSRGAQGDESRKECGNPPVRTVTVGAPWNLSADVPRGWTLDLVIRLEAGEPMTWPVLNVLTVQGKHCIRAGPELRLEPMLGCPAGAKPSDCLAARIRSFDDRPRTVRLGRWEWLEDSYRTQRQFCTSDPLEGRVHAFLLETAAGVLECSLHLWEDRKDPERMSRESVKYRSDHESFCASIRLE